MLRELRSLLVMVAVAFFLSLAMEPAVDRLARRGWRRGSATGLVLGMTILIVARLPRRGRIDRRRADTGHRRSRASLRQRGRAVCQRHARHQLGCRLAGASAPTRGHSAAEPRHDRVERVHRCVPAREGTPPVRDGDHLRVLHDRRRPETASNDLRATSSSPSRDGARHVGDRDRQDRRLPVFTRDPSGDLRRRHERVPVCARRAVRARPRIVGRRGLAVHSHDRDVHRDGAATRGRVRGPSRAARCGC